MIRRTAAEWNGNNPYIRIVDPDSFHRFDFDMFELAWYCTPMTWDEFVDASCGSTCEFFVPWVDIPIGDWWVEEDE